MQCVNFAREQSLLLAVRGGGHNGGGLGICDEGLVIDLSGLKGIRVDVNAKTVRVEGGCTWGDVDHATHAFGLATPSGIISTTGVGGLTLGGGLGHLTRKCGLAVDNLLEADVVLADGTLVTANAEQHPELYWALRGGGGNFGVVTSFLFRLHPVSTVVAGPTFWSLEQAGKVMRWYRDFIRSGAGRPERLLRLPDRAAGRSVPEGAARQEGLWRGLVLHRPGSTRPTRCSSRSPTSARR